MLAKFNITPRSGGLNLWLELPDHINMHQLSGSLLAKNVKVRTADVFTASNTQLRSNALRIAIGGPDTRELFERGVVIFSQVLEKLNADTDVVI